MVHRGMKEMDFLTKVKPKKILYIILEFLLNFDSGTLLSLNDNWKKMIWKIGM
jgi:hypothetical protein